MKISDLITIHSTSICEKGIFSIFNKNRAAKYDYSRVF